MERSRDPLSRSRRQQGRICSLLIFFHPTIPSTNILVERDEFQPLQRNQRMGSKSSKSTPPSQDAPAKPSPANPSPAKPSPAATASKPKPTTKPVAPASTPSTLPSPVSSTVKTAPATTAASTPTPPQAAAKLSPQAFASLVQSLPFSVGSTVKTIYGTGTVTSITAPDKVQVTLDSWRLAEYSTTQVQCYVSVGDVKVMPTVVKEGDWVKVGNDHCICCNFALLLLLFCCSEVFLGTNAYLFVYFPPFLFSSFSATPAPAS